MFTIPKVTQGPDFCQILTPHIDNAPDVLSKIDKLCPVDVPLTFKKNRIQSAQSKKVKQKLE